MGILAECPICHKRQGIKNKVCKCGENLDAAKRGKRARYWIAYRMPDGKQRRESLAKIEGCDPFSIKDARDAFAKKSVLKRERRLFDPLPEETTTFNELTEWYLGLKDVKALAYFPILSGLLEKFNSKFGDFTLHQLQPADLKDYQATERAKGYSDSYIDQQIGAGRGMLYKALDNGMVTGGFIRVFKKAGKLLKRNSNARDRTLSKSEFESLVAALSKTRRSRHIKAIVQTAYYTGMRRGEILSLTWDKVRLKDRIIRLEPEDTKDGEARNIPIGGELLEILLTLDTRLTNAKRQNNHVFQYGGQPVSDIRSGIMRACKDAGIPYGRGVKRGFTFHDLRHTFNTNMRKAGVQESVIMAITGHSTREMFDRYNTVDAEDGKRAAEALAAHLSKTGGKQKEAKNS